MTRRLAFDVGRSRCRAAVYDAGGRDAAAEVATRGTLTDRDGVAAVADVLAEAVARLGSAAAGAGSCCAAVAGAAGHRDAPAVARALSQAVGAPLALTADVVAAHAGALGGRAGVVVAAGTGAIAYGLADDGRDARVDGWGYLLGDDGSGFAVGRAGLAAALRAHDGRGDPTALVEHAVARFGALDALPHAVHATAAPARTVAAFATEVAAAARAGDAVAAAIWRDAVDALVASAVAAAAPLDAPAVPVSWTGGLFGADDLVAAPFRARLGDADARLVATDPVGDALDGAALLAVDRDRPHEARMVRSDG